MISINLNQDNFVNFQPQKPINKAIRLGKYGFINCLPLNLPVELIPDQLIESTFGTPNEINNLLKKELIDVGPLSTYEYLVNKDNYILLDNISISSQKQVGSVILFSKYNLKDLHNKKIAVAYTSSTSVQLLQLLLKTLTNSYSSFTKHYYEKSLHDHLKDFDAVLYIGDPALLSSFTINCNTSIKAYDLAEQWFKINNLPMVFCVWVASKKWVEKNPDSFDYISQCLESSKSLGLNQMFNDVIIKANEVSGLSENILKNYYKNQLSYDFSKIHKESIDLFYCQLKKNNLL